MDAETPANFGGARFCCGTRRASSAARSWRSIWRNSGHEVREIARLEKEYNATDEALVRLFKETEAAQEAAKKKNTGEMSEEARATLVAASDRREKILHELRLRIRINSERKKELAEEGSLVSRAIDHKRKTHDALGRDPINAEVETVPREAFGGDVELRVVAEREADIDAEVEAWRETVGTFRTDGGAGGTVRANRAPRRDAVGARAGARARGRRADGGFALRAIGGGGGPALDGDGGPLPPVARHPHHLPPRSPGEGGDARVAEEALREQERLLAEEGGGEAKRAREEKAKAKRAEVRQRAKHLRERELVGQGGGGFCAHARGATSRGVRRRARAIREAGRSPRRRRRRRRAEAEFARRRAQRRTRSQGTGKRTTMR